MPEAAKLSKLRVDSLKCTCLLPAWGYLKKNTAQTPAERAARSSLCQPTFRLSMSLNTTIEALENVHSSVKIVPT
ncbi:hypothetical protein TNCV_2836811 [Trichonephila clavipes]|nr:hypothetical protein TNCV_2836811 [Trichonephila clavipes]